MQHVNLRSLLMPSSEKLTRELVKRSAVQRQQTFDCIVNVLVATSEMRSESNRYFAAQHRLSNECESTSLQRLSSPVFRSWLNAFGRVDFKDPADELKAYQVSLWSNMCRNIWHSGDDWEDDFLVVENTVPTWDVRWLISGIVANTVRITHQNDLVSVADDARILLAVRIDHVTGEPIAIEYAAEGCSLGEAARLPNSHIVLRNDHPLLHVRLREDVEPSRGYGVILDKLDHNRRSYPSEIDKKPYLEAAALLQRYWPQEYNDWQHTIQAVIPRLAPHGWKMEGFTISSFQGACWISPGDVVTVLEAMVHEQSHVKLRYIEENIPLLDPNQTSELFGVAWRTDKRPIIGIYEGVYVHIHSIVALLEVAKAATGKPRVTRQCEERARELIDQVTHGIDILRHKARFTQAGKTYLTWAQDMASCLSQETVRGYEAQRYEKLH